MRNHVLDAYRRRAITSARGLVLEIGVSSGLNLSLYGPAAGRVVGLDPSSELLRLARKRATRMVIPVSMVRASAERIPFADCENVEGIEELSSTKCRNITGKIHKLTFVIELPKLTDEDEKKLAESYRAAQDAT